MLFAFICLDKPDSEGIRSRLRPTHIEYMLRILDRTAFGGPLQDNDGQTSRGSIFAAEFASRAEAEAFIANEPYNRGGLFESVSVRRWKQMAPEPKEGFLLAELERERRKQGLAAEA